MDEVKQLLSDLRGGIPDTCDWCQRKRPEGDLHSVSGGSWVCTFCLNTSFKAAREAHENKQTLE